MDNLCQGVAGVFLITAQASGSGNPHRKNPLSEIRIGRDSLP